MFSEGEEAWVGLRESRDQLTFKKCLTVSCEHCGRLDSGRAPPKELVCRRSTHEDCSPLVVGDWFQDYPTTTTTKTKSMNAQVSSIPQDVEVNYGSLLKNNSQKTGAEKDLS